MIGRLVGRLVLTKAKSGWAPYPGGSERLWLVIDIRWFRLGTVDGREVDEMLETGRKEIEWMSEMVRIEPYHPSLGDTSIDSPAITAIPRQATHNEPRRRT